MSHTDDEGLVARAAKRVLGAITVSAKIDGEMAERLDARVAMLVVDYGHCTRADVIRSALGRYLDAADAETARHAELEALHQRWAR